MTIGERWLIIKHNSKQLLIAIDQVFNVLVRFCHEKTYGDETLSSRCYRWDRDGVTSIPRKLVDLLFFWETDHCYESYISEQKRYQLPPEFRKD